MQPIIKSQNLIIKSQKRWRKLDSEMSQNFNYHTEILIWLMCKKPNETHNLWCGQMEIFSGIQKL